MVIFEKAFFMSPAFDFSWHRPLRRTLVQHNAMQQSEDVQHRVRRLKAVRPVKAMCLLKYNPNVQECDATEAQCMYNS